MVMEDRATKHCRLFAIKDTKAKSVAACLETYVSQMGCPDRWGTDGGKEFFDRLILAMCSVFNIHKEFSPLQNLLVGFPTLHCTIDMII